MIAPAPLLKVPRGEPVEIELVFESDLGSPAPTLVLTLACRRNAAIKLYELEADHVVGEPTLYRFLIPSTETDRAVGRYWWDVWRLDLEQLLAIGPLDVEGVVRLP